MGFSAFWAGLSGLQAHDGKLNVIGNNLANVNTIGFKGSRMTFQDIFSQTLNGPGVNGAANPIQVGLGTQIAGIAKLFGQGSLQVTGLTTDVAIQGGGFFTLRNLDGTPGFTRAGSFSFDKDGYLVTPAGQRVQGYTQLDANGNIIASGAPADIQIASGLTAPPQPTSTFSLSTNLNANAAVDDPLTAGVNEAETFSTTVAIYDSLGGKHDVTVTFTPTDTDADGVLDDWAYDATVPGAEVAGGVAGTPFSIGAGTIQFDSQGVPVIPGGNVTLTTPAWANGAAAQSLTWELFASSGQNSVTGFAGQSATSSIVQNGFGVGQLSVLTIDVDGRISGLFTNGRSLQLAQFALANFNNLGGLLSTGQNGYLETAASGAAAIGAANSGGRGQIYSNSLELSNVDLTTELTELIIAQRGYQANTRVITTTDELLQEALTLKR